MNKYKEFSKVHLVIEYNACGKKKRFSSKKESYQKGQISYKCYYCGKWHRASVKKKIGKTKNYSLCSVR